MGYSSGGGQAIFEGKPILPLLIFLQRLFMIPQVMAQTVFILFLPTIHPSVVPRIKAIPEKGRNRWLRTWGKSTSKVTQVPFYHKDKQP